MKIKYSKIGWWMLFVVVLAGCRPDDTVPPKVNEDALDPSILEIDRDFFIYFRINEGEIDDRVVRIIPEHDNEVTSESYSPGLCRPLWGDTVGRYVHVQRLTLRDTTKTAESADIEFTRCVRQNTPIRQRDSITFMEGARPFLSLPDSTSGIQIVYRDRDDVLWSSKFGSNSGSRFVLSARIPNRINDKYRYVVFGEFDCDLYNDSGERKRITRGRFKMFAAALTEAERRALQQQ